MFNWRRVESWTENYKISKFASIVKSRQIYFIKWFLGSCCIEQEERLFQIGLHILSFQIVSHFSNLVGVHVFQDIVVDKIYSAVWSLSFDLQSRGIAQIIKIWFGNALFISWLGQWVQAYYILYRRQNKDFNIFTNSWYLASQISYNTIIFLFECFF